MAIVTLKCTNCHGDIQLDDSREFGFCMYCGTKVLIKQDINNINVQTSFSEQISRMKVSMGQLFSAGRYDDALELADQIISMKCTDPDVWLMAARSFVRSMEAMRMFEDDYRKHLAGYLHQYSLLSGESEPDIDVFSQKEVGDSYLKMLGRWKVQYKGSGNYRLYRHCLERIQDMYPDDRDAFLESVVQSIFDTYSNIGSVMDMFEGRSTGLGISDDDLSEAILEEAHHHVNILGQVFKRCVATGLFANDLILAARFSRIILSTDSVDQFVKRIELSYIKGYIAQTYGTCSDLLSWVVYPKGASESKVRFSVGMWGQNRFGKVKGRRCDSSLEIIGPDGKVMFSGGVKNQESYLSDSVEMEIMTPYEVHVAADGISDGFQFVIVGSKGGDPRVVYSRMEDQDKGSLDGSDLLVLCRRVG